MDKIKVTQIRSPIGRNKTQKETLIGLGLNKISKSKIFTHSKSIQGMVDKVKHLVKVEKI